MTNEELKNMVSELKIDLKDTMYISSLCGFSEVRLLSWMNGKEAPPEKAKRISFLVDVVREIKHQAPDLTLRDVLVNARCFVSDERATDPNDEDDYTISLIGFVCAFYNFNDMVSDYKKYISEAIQEYRDWQKSRGF